MSISENHSISEEYKSSLLAKVTGITLASSLLMGSVILIIGMTIYTIALVDQYITESFCLARSTSAVADSFPEIEHITDQIMDVYHSMTDEERGDFNSEKYREKLMAKLKEILEDKNVDEQRVITEAAIFSEKIAIDEETVRLRSHISQCFTL